MNTRWNRVSAAGVLGWALLAAAPLHAQAVIYPNAGQTPEQLAADRAACQSQASAQSGFDPSQPAPAAASTAPARGQRLAGAARGAAVGGVVERNSDEDEREIEDPSRAAARAGAVVGGSRQRQDRRESRRSAQQQQTDSQQRAAFDQAFGACMAARGYTVQ